jgi:hypothetical protein
MFTASAVDLMFCGMVVFLAAHAHTPAHNNPNPSVRGVNAAPLNFQTVLTDMDTAAKDTENIYATEYA